MILFGRICPENQTKKRKAGDEHHRIGPFPGLYWTSKTAAGGLIFPAACCCFYPEVILPGISPAAREGY